MAFVSTSDKFRSKMSELKHEPLEDSVIVGVAGKVFFENLKLFLCYLINIYFFGEIGAMLAEATTRDIDVACLVAPTVTIF